MCVCASEAETWGSGASFKCRLIFLSPKCVTGRYLRNLEWPGAQGLSLPILENVQNSASQSPGEVLGVSTLYRIL